nr:MAG TPA: hypothetical protein [Caudoviricetes sp.]
MRKGVTINYTPIFLSKKYSNGLATIPNLYVFKRKKHHHRSTTNHVMVLFYCILLIFVR